MSTHNLAIVFGPTLFQSDGKDYTAGRVVEELIANYVEIFNVDEEEMRKQQHEIAAIMKMREAASSGTQQAGDFICTVYLEEKRTEMEQHVKIPATMTAEELTCEILRPTATAWNAPLRYTPTRSGCTSSAPTAPKAPANGCAPSLSPSSRRAPRSCWSATSIASGG